MSASLVAEAPAARRATPRLALVAAGLLGLFFLVSGVGKLLDVATFQAKVADFGVPGLLTYGALFLPPLEILLGLALLLRPSAGLAVVSFALLALFTVAYAYAYAAHGVRDCGCFGAFTALRVSPALSFLRNAVMLAASCYLWYSLRRRPRSGLGAGRWALLGVVGAVAFTLSGVSSHQRLYGSRAEALRGQPVRQTPLASFLPASPDASALVFVFHPACNHCWDAMENVKAFQRTGAVDHVVGLSIGADSALAAFVQRFDPGFPIQTVARDQARLFVERVPTAFVVSGDTVRYVWTGEVMSPHSFALIRRMDP